MHHFNQHPENKKIICWDKDDIGFVVIDVVSFTREILPKYFRHSNFSSFVRQVAGDVCSSTCMTSIKLNKTMRCLFSKIHNFVEESSKNCDSSRGRQPRRSLDISAFTTSKNLNTRRRQP
jgi:hypothetical protein